MTCPERQETPSTSGSPVAMAAVVRRTPDEPDDSYVAEPVREVR